MTVARRPRYRRVVIKLSGEALGSDETRNVDPAAVEWIAGEIQSARKAGVQIAVVVGGGNIIRGAELAKSGITPTAADSMGMIATVINGMALQDTLERLGLETRLQTAIPMTAVAEPFIRRRAIRHLEKGRVVILAASTGSPHFTTDTAAALRARELEAEVLLKATNVDGVYTADPKKDKSARKFLRLSFDDVLRKNLRVMDLTAITLCREANLPIIVFNLARQGNIRRAVCGEPVGTRVGGD